MSLCVCEWVSRFATTDYIITGLQTAAYIWARTHTHSHTHTLHCTQKAEVAKNTKQLKPTNAAAANSNSNNNSYIQQQHTKWNFFVAANN